MVIKKLNYEHFSTPVRSVHAQWFYFTLLGATRESNKAIAHGCAIY